MAPLPSQRQFAYDCIRQKGNVYSRLQKEGETEERPADTYLPGRHFRTERRLHKVVDFSAGLRCQIVRGGVVFEFEFGPHHKMDDILFCSVWPVVEQDFVVVCSSPSRDRQIPVIASLC